MRNTAFAAIALASTLALAACGAGATSNAGDSPADAPVNAATTQPVTRQSYGGGTGAGGLGARGTTVPAEASQAGPVVGTTLAIPNPPTTPTPTALP